MGLLYTIGLIGLVVMAVAFDLRRDSNEDNKIIYLVHFRTGQIFLLSSICRLLVSIGEQKSLFLVNQLLLTRLYFLLVGITTIVGTVYVLKNKDKISSSLIPFYYSGMFWGVFMILHAFFYPGVAHG